MILRARQNVENLSNWWVVSGRRYDLSAELGVCWEGLNSPVLASAILKIRDAGLKAGKTMWHFDASVTNFVCVGEANGLMTGAFKSAREAAEATRAKVAAKGQGDQTDQTDQPELN